MSGVRIASPAFRRPLGVYAWGSFVFRESAGCHSHCHAHCHQAQGSRACGGCNAGPLLHIPRKQGQPSDPRRARPPAAQALRGRHVSSHAVHRRPGMPGCLSVSARVPKAAWGWSGFLVEGALKPRPHYEKSPPSGPYIISQSSMMDVHFAAQYV